MIVLLCGWWSGFCFVWCLLQGLLSWRTWTQHGGISVLLTGIMNHRWEWTNELTLLITEFKQFNTDLHWSRRKVMKYAVKELNKSFFVLAIIGHTHFLMGFLAFPFSRTVVNFVVWLHRCYTSCTIRWSIMLARSLKGLAEDYYNHFEMTKFDTTPSNSVTKMLQGKKTRYEAIGFELVWQKIVRTESLCNDV